MLMPSSFSHWCRGTYGGRVQEFVSGSCPKGELCPTYIAIITIDRLTFIVRARGSRPSPALHFAGLATISAACGSGSQGHGQMTWYRLGWRPATDGTSPSSQLVYDIYASHTPGGEDFSAPTWTTSPGASTYTTPPVPAGGYYFVVRARDRAGHEDQNRVERGGGWCAYPGARSGALLVPTAP
jgi:hypothetical protein